MSPKKHTTKTGFDPGHETIVVKGARTHNLKNITVEMPRNKMIVFTGLSGSGKSSLAFALESAPDGVSPQNDPPLPLS